MSSVCLWDIAIDCIVSLYCSAKKACSWKAVAAAVAAAVVIGGLLLLVC